MGAYDQAITPSQHVTALAIAGDEVVLHAQANRSLGRTYLGQTDYCRAIDCLDQAAKFFEAAQHHGRVGQASPPIMGSRAWLGVPVRTKLSPAAMEF
jgi:hypothetical protein